MSLVKRSIVEMPSLTVPSIVCSKMSSVEHKCCEILGAIALISLDLL